MYNSVTHLIQQAQKIIIIQAENPDGDSLGSSLALEEILGDLGKDVVLYCPVDIPKYMRYIQGWDRVVQDFDTTADLAIIVDTAADVLMTKVLETRGVRHYLESHPVIVIDHHTETVPNLSFGTVELIEEAPAAAQVVYHLATQAGWSINPAAAENLMVGLQADTLGMTTQNVTPESFFVAGKLTEQGASVAKIEERRRDFMKKPQSILEYKGRLIERIEYYLDGKLALIRIPFEEIQEYSDLYNPSVLVLDEMRLVVGVELAVAIKSYPDGKQTGKLRSNSPISADVAGFFGGGGHKYAAGFRVYDDQEQIVRELIDATAKSLSEDNPS